MTQNICEFLHVERGDGFEVELTDSDWLNCNICGNKFDKLGIDIEFEASTYDYSLEHVSICHHCIKLIDNRLNELGGLL